MRCASTRRSSVTRPPEGPTGLPSRRSATFARVAPASYEAFCEPYLLGGLRQASHAGPRPRRQELRPPKREPAAPSLQFKRVGRVWSVRIGLRYRALATEADGNLVWFWIGSHADYDALLEEQV